MTGRWVLRVAAVGAALLSALTVLLFTMVGGSGLSLRAFEPAIETVLAAHTDAEDVELGSVRLVRDGNDEAPFRIDITDFSMTAQNGTDVTLPFVSMRLNSESLIRGQTLPRFAEINRATIRVERSGEQLAVGGSTQEQGAFDIGELISTAVDIGFEGAILNDVTLDYVNVATGRRFHVENGKASLRKESDTYVFRINVPYPDHGGVLNLDFFARVSDDTFDATLSADRVPASAVLPLLFGEVDRLDVDALVSGTITSFGTRAEGFDEFGIALYSEGASVRVADKVVPLSAVAFDGVFDPQSTNLRIDRFLGDALGVKLDGRGRIASQPSGDLDFEFAVRDVVLDPEGVFQAPLPLTDLSVLGSFVPSARQLNVSKFNGSFFDHLVSASGAVSFPVNGQSLGVAADLSVDGRINVDEVLRGWPLNAGDGARRWVVASLPKGAIENVQYAVNIPRGHFSSGGVFGSDQSALTFDIKDASVVFVPGLAPIAGLNAKARLAGNSFHVDGGGGRLGQVRVKSGRVRMNQLVPKGAPALYEVEVEGPIPSLLGIINQDPIDYLSSSGFSVDDFRGDGQFTIKIIRPMLVSVPQSDYSITGSGRFWNADLIDKVPAVAIENGTGTIQLKPSGLFVQGTVDADGIPSDFSLTRWFGRGGRMDLEASTTIDARAADALGLPFRRYVRGDVPLKLAAVGNARGFNEFTVRGDLAQATITDHQGQEIKPEGAAGALELDIALAADRTRVDIETLRVGAGGINLEGNAAFAMDGGLIDLDMPRLFVEDYADLSLRMRREDSGLVVKVEGDHLYAGDALQDILGRDEGQSLPGPINVSAQLNRVSLKKGVTLNDVRIDAMFGAVGVERLSGVGKFGAGGDLTVALQPDLGGLGRELRLNTTRAGLVLKGMFGVESVSAAAGSFAATLVDDGPLAGTFRAENIVVQDAPLVARLLSVGSLTGLENVLNGEGLAFDTLTGDVQVDNGVLNFVDARLTGPALGFSANGTVELLNRDIAIHGAIAPAYQVNSLLGAIPGVGDLLVSRKGEGVFALAYRIDGPVSEPVISVNSLAALAPGIFRRMFEPVTRKRPTTEEILNAAEAAVADMEAMDTATPEQLQEMERDREQSTAVPQ